MEPQIRFRPFTRMFRLAVLLLLSSALAGCGPSRPPWADGAVIRTEVPDDGRAQNLSDLPRRLLALHNRERSEAGIPPLSWDARLAADSAAYGPQLARLGRLAHSPRESRPGQGENLWMGTAGAFSVEEMVGGWAGERRLFRPGIFPDDLARHDARRLRTPPGVGLRFPHLPLRAGRKRRRTARSLKPQERAACRCASLASKVRTTFSGGALSSRLTMMAAVPQRRNPGPIS